MAADAGWQVHMLDSTVIRVHACAAGARRPAGEQALGRSRGGFSTKLHLQADAYGRPRWKPAAILADEACSAA
jgi:hypothetical protein